MQENNFQEQFLTELCAERQPVSVFLVSGIQLKGQIIGFDQYVIILKKEKILQMVYKHAVSTILCQKEKS